MYPGLKHTKKAPRISEQKTSLPSAKPFCYSRPIIFTERGQKRLFCWRMAFQSKYNFQQHLMVQN